MKVWTSKYRNHWVSPYTILKAVCFWEKDDGVFYDHDELYKPVYGKCVNFLNPICVAWQRFLDSVHPRWSYIKIDHWDIWSLDHTLADVILPSLKLLREKKHGSPFVDDEDVPPHLQSDAYKQAKKRTKKTSGYPNVHSIDDADSTLHDRWAWVLDEMIWAFEQKVDDTAEDRFFDNSNASGLPWEADYIPGKFDKEGYDAWHKRKANGFRLFGKYFEALWD